MNSPFRTVDLILQHGRSPSGQIELSWTNVLATVFCCSFIYGAVMGSYAWIVGHRSFAEQSWQIGYSGVKVSMLLGMTTVVALPSFFVFNSLLGLRNDFRLVARSILSVQAGLAIILASLAPLTLFFYASSTGTTNAYRAAVLFNALVLGIASVSAQLLLRVYYRPLIARNVLHRRMLWAWIGLYAFVGIQCGWILRPFIGDHRQDVAFFREEKFGNAYVKVWEMVSGLL